MKKTFKLPKKFTEDWLEALESGRYKQATKTLYNDKTQGYCCLGVACSLVGISNVVMDGHSLPSDMLFYLPDEFPEILIEDIGNNILVNILTNLNDGVMHPLTLESNIRMCPNLTFPKTETTVINELEAIKAYSFKEIAQFIRDNVELIED